MVARRIICGPTKRAVPRYYLRSGAGRAPAYPRATRSFPAMIRFTLAALLTVGMAAAAASAQTGPTPARREPGNAFQTILARRAELGLTAEQTRRLEAIAADLEELNTPLRERLREERQRFVTHRRAELERMSPRERRAELRRMRREGRPPLPADMRPITEEMRGNIRDAAKRARDVLTPEQRGRLRAVLREAVQARRRGDSMRGHRRP